MIILRKAMEKIKYYFKRFYIETAISGVGKYRRIWPLLNGKRL